LGKSARWTGERNDKGPNIGKVNARRKPENVWEEEVGLWRKKTAAEKLMQKKRQAGDVEKRMSLFVGTKQKKALG